jgi:hypothetical protein
MADTEVPPSAAAVGAAGNTSQDGEPDLNVCPPKVEDQLEVDRLYKEITATVTELNCEKANEFEQQWRTFNAFFAVSDDDRLGKAQEFIKFVEGVFGADFAHSAGPKLVPLVSDTGVLFIFLIPY